MSVIEEILECENGSRFWRADLHIHSFGATGSYDVTDNQMTPSNIVDCAMHEGLSVISITDHNEIENSLVAIEYSKEKPILVVPGVELSTPNGHLLLYAPDGTILRKIFGQLNISHDRKTCTQTIVQCLDIAGSLGGFGVAAHIDLDAGFEKYFQGYTLHKSEILCHKFLYAMEISSIEEVKMYTDQDTNPERKRLLNERRAALQEDHTYDIPKVLNSDSHKLTALGRNAAGLKRVTRVKMDLPSFEGLKTAFIDASARVRIEDLVPASIARFIGAKFDGGFLDGQIIKFSSNLTCIIGGRGAGKSTVLESTRVSSGNDARGEIVDNEVWPNRISLLYEDEAGRQILFIKDKNRELFNQSDPDEGIIKVAIESFGQGQTAETLHHSDKNPGVIIDFFDEFIDFEDLKGCDSAICQKLLENQTQIERLSLDVRTIPEIKRAKANADAQVAQLKKNNAKEAVELEEGLANERALRRQLVDLLNQMLRSLFESFADKTPFEFLATFEEEKILTGKIEYQEVKVIVQNFSALVDSHSSKLQQESKAIIEELKSKLATWQEKEKTVQNRIEEIRKSIEKSGGKLDISYIQKVTKDAIDFKNRLSQLQLKEGQLTDLRKSRAKLIEERLAIRAKIFNKRLGFVTLVNQNLKSTISEFSVSIKIFQGAFSPALTEAIKTALNWRTSQVPRAEILVRDCGFEAIIESLSKNDSAKFGAINVDGSNLFSAADARNILATLKEPINRNKIERCEVNDLITITLTRPIPNSPGKVVRKDFSQLSLGQQQSIMLTIMLSSNRTCPLLIDQPEDNLDGEFIFKTLVRNLRRVKERRQVILATHNANITVLGDAELIAPLRSTNEKSIFVDRGSIDRKETQKLACAILEGGEKAFIKRKEIYGL